MGAIQISPTSSAVAVTTSYIDLVANAQLPINRVSFNKAGVGANGSCNLLLVLDSAVTSDLTLKVDVVNDGIAYTYHEVAEVSLTGLSANVSIPLNLPLAEKITVQIKATVGFTVNSGFILFQD